MCLRQCKVRNRDIYDGVGEYYRMVSHEINMQGYYR